MEPFDGHVHFRPFGQLMLVVQVLDGRLPCLVCPLRLLALHSVLPLAGACLSRVLLHIRFDLLRTSRCWLDVE